MKASNLRVERTKAGMTQAELAAKAGVSRYSIHNIETGRYADCSVKLLGSIAKALNLPVTTLFFDIFD